MEARRDSRAARTFGVASFPALFHVGLGIWSISSRSPLPAHTRAGALLQSGRNARTYNDSIERDIYAVYKGITCSSGVHTRSYRRYTGMSAHKHSHNCKYARACPQVFALRGAHLRAQGVRTGSKIIERSSKDRGPLFLCSVRKPL